MKLNKGRKTFSLNYLFASFFGALMIASAFAYYNYRFSEYKFVDFEEWTFYQKADIFQPTKEAYTVLVYSSNQHDVTTLLTKLTDERTIIAVDLYQKRLNGDTHVIHVSAGMNTLLPFVQRFNIYEVPSAFRIKRHNKRLYKQDSPIEVVR